MIDQASWLAILPEILLLSMACVITLVDLRVRSTLRTTTFALSMGTLGVLALLEAYYGLTGFTFYGFGNMVVSDGLGAWLKCFSALAMMATLVYSRPYAAERDMLRGGELFILGLFALLGMFIMISGNNFLVIYMGLELLTLSSYALVALRRDHTQATEAAMKYFVLGAMASGFLLYGMSMLYGATGTLNISTLFQTIVSGNVQHQVLIFGLVFIVAGLAFKLGAVPFHMWVPDVYQGAPTAVTLMIAGAPKLAAFSILIRLLVEGMFPLSIDWQQMLMVLSVGSLVVGNLAAIAQTNMKRMLAYSTISQMGFVLLGLMSGVVNGNPITAANAYSSSMFYMVTYVLTTVATFGVMMLLSAKGFESEEIADFAGLNQRSPLYAGVMAMCMFSFAGIPPMVGFYAKLSVLQALVLNGNAVAYGVALLAVLMSLIGSFYYLRVVKVMYFDPPLTASSVVASKQVRIVLSINAGLILLLGVLPGGLMNLCAQAILQMLGT